MLKISPSTKATLISTAGNERLALRAIGKAESLYLSKGSVTEAIIAIEEKKNNPNIDMASNAYVELCIQKLALKSIEDSQNAKKEVESMFL